MIPGRGLAEPQGKLFIDKKSLSKGNLRKGGLIFPTGRLW
jgi:hypothetical protein